MSRRLLLLGRGIARSLSPALHAPLLAKAAPGCAYGLLDLPEAAFPAGLAQALRDPEVVGLNVTAPYKFRIAPLLDALDDSARAALGAVNCVYRRTGEDGRPLLFGANTDGEGFLLALRDAGRPPAGERCGIAGAGGAAAAVASALLRAGALEVRIHARRRGQAEDLARALGDPRAKVAGAPEELSGCALLVHATPSRPPALPEASLDEATLVVDLNTTDLDPALPAFLRERGIAYADGTAMLARQAALCYPLWFGAAPPLDELPNVDYNYLRRGTPSPIAFP